MTAITDAQYAAMRTWVGTEPTDDELQDRYDRLGNFDKVVLEALEYKLALLSEQPASLTVPGLSISVGQNMTMLEAAIKRFRSSGGLGLDTESAGLGFSVVQITRPDYR